MRDYSLSINAYERPKALRRLLISLKEGNWNFHSLVVVDDASTEENFKTILRLCRNFECDLVRKRKRQYLTSSWNLGMIYCNTRYHLTTHADVIFPKDSKFLMHMEAGFDLGYSIVSVAGTLKSFAIDKAIIPLLSWHDERYPFLRIEDGDFLLRAKEKLGKDWTFTRHHEQGIKDPMILHQADGYSEGNRSWLEDREESLHLDFFFKKWHVDKEEIIRRRPHADPSLQKVGDPRARYAQFAYEMGLVKRKLADVDFYPKVTQRYKENDFSSVIEAVEPFADIYKFRGE